MELFREETEKFNSVEDENLLEFKINKEFAEKFEFNKKREELSRLSEKYQDHEQETDYETETDSEDDVVEDEVGQLVTPEIDAMILKTIGLLQKKDASIYDPSLTLFDEKKLKGARDKWTAKKKEKVPQSMTLKQYHQKRLLGLLPTTDIPTDSNGGEATNFGKDASFVQQQESLKSEFKEAAAALDTVDDDLFTIRNVENNTMDDTKTDNDTYAEYLLGQMEGDARTEWTRTYEQATNSLKTKNGNLNETPSANEIGIPGGKNEDEFLMKYVLTRGWIGPEAEAVEQDQTMHDSTDEEGDELAESFETAYNFRFEETSGMGGDPGRVVTYARNVPGTMRRTDNSRVIRRQTEKERKELARQVKVNELKRLKVLKRQEIMKRLSEIKEMAGEGVGELELDGVDLEQEFDPIQHDIQMDKVFSESSYYEFKDGKGGKKVSKPKWKDDIDISDIIPEDQDQSEVKWKGKRVFEKVHKNNRHGKKQQTMDDGFEGVDQEAQETPASASESQTIIDKYMQEYYNLDYEDIIDTIPVRFKYRAVEAESYSLNVDDILMADEKDLNQVVALKKLAPYRSKERVERDNAKWKVTKKKKLWEFRSKMKAKEAGGKRKEVKVGEEVERGEDKRIRKAAKIDQGRLAAYKSK